MKKNTTKIMTMIFFFAFSAQAQDIPFDDFSKDLNNIKEKNQNNLSY